MLLTPFNPLFKRGVTVRPRAVTSPVRVHGQGGTYGESREMSNRENIDPNLRPMPIQTANRAAKKHHYFSTIHIPRLRESHRTNMEVTSTATSRQSPSNPLIHGLPVVPASSARIKRDQSLNSDLDPDPFVDQLERGAPSPEVDLAGPPPSKSASLRATVERPSHGWPQTEPRPESPLTHARRRAGHNVPPAHVETFPTIYRLSIALPRPGGAQLASEMITVSARRGGRLAIVADAWHLEHDCHYEWHIAFPQLDIDLGAVRARLDKDGILSIDVPRR